MAEMTMRDALNQALREELARDEAVFLMGEEVAEYQGAYKVTRGLLDELGPKGLLKSAIRDDDPVIFIEQERMYGMKGEVPEDEDFTIPLGVAEVKRKGTDATIVARSLMVPVALKAAEELEKDGVSCEVIDPRTIRPLDIDTIIASVKKTNRVVIAEESHPFCGVGAEISAQIAERAFDYLDAPVKRVSGADVPMPYAKNLELLALPDYETIIQAVREVSYL